jgi:predicted DNA-binding transcriptional regulator AlpA
MTTATAVAPRLLSMGEVCRLTGLTPKTVRRWARAGRFPRPLPIGVRNLWWSAEEVEDALRRGYTVSKCDKQRPSRRQLPEGSPRGEK